MKALSAVVFMLATCSIAGRVDVDLPGLQRSEWLQYHDGTPQWATWEGTYRGIWFNLQDFLPGVTFFYIDTSEMWFYHFSDKPWDTSDVYFELWNGDAMGPISRIDQTQVTAVHFAPVYASYDPSIYVNQHFWCIANTEASTGGWPSILSDNAGGTIYHSFYSDDFIAWEPWDVGGACNYFIAIVEGVSLEATSWGSIKSVF